MDDSNKPENPAAFPTATEQWGGMTLRDYFAAKVMQAVLSNPDAVYAACRATSTSATQSVPMVAYDMADAMLRERERVKP